MQQEIENPYSTMCLEVDVSNIRVEFSDLLSTKGASGGNGIAEL